MLQNHRSRGPPLQFYVFDLLILRGKYLTQQPLEKRRELLRTKVMPRLPDTIRYSETLQASPAELIEAAREQGFEGIVAKRRDSLYEPGKRSGAWQKMRVLQSREFVIGGYTPGGRNFDGILIGYYEGREFVYVAKVHAGFADYYSAIVDDKGMLRDGYSGDGLHPNDKGYELLAPVAEAAIDKALLH